MNTPTARLHHADSWLTSFDATVVAHSTVGKQASVVLDQTAFFAEGGGQLFDLGTLGGQCITNVQVDDAGVVHHVVEGVLPAVGSAVHGEIDRVRRRLHMAQHTAQHMLSRALLDVVQAETVSARLGAGGCTIDLGVEKLAPEAWRDALDRVNAAVDEDRPIRAFFPSESELKALPLRRSPKVEENIRVVQVEGFDVSPCGGTHCTSTSQVGLVRGLGMERTKGMIRVFFEAGKRARDTLEAEAAVLRGMATTFTCGPLEVGTVVEKLQRELQAARETLGLVRARVAQAQADALLDAARAAGRTTVVALLEDGDPDYLRAVVKRLTAHPEMAVVVAGRGDGGMPVVCSRGDLSTFDCGATLKRMASEGGGKGGGRPNHAEGRLPASADFHALVRGI
jgi:alanyl-tRNA synthetase